MTAWQTDQRHEGTLHQQVHSDMHSHRNGQKYLELPVEEAHGGDPGCDDTQEGGGDDGHATLDTTETQQQCLCDPARTCTHMPSQTDSLNMETHS